MCALRSTRSTSNMPLNKHYYDGSDRLPVYEGPTMLELLALALMFVTITVEALVLWRCVGLFE